MASKETIKTETLEDEQKNKTPKTDKISVVKPVLILIRYIPPNWQLGVRPSDSIGARPCMTKLGMEDTLALAVAVYMAHGFLIINKEYIKNEGLSIWMGQNPNVDMDYDNPATKAKNACGEQKAFVSIKTY